MILECPACSAKFSVPAKAVPPGGRSVRCSRCRHEWHAYATQDAPVIVEPVMKPIEIAPPEPEPQAVPMDDDFLSRVELAMAQQEATQKTFKRSARTTEIKPPRSAKPFKIAVPCIAAAWAVLAMFTYYPTWSYSALGGKVYSAFGVEPADGLVFSDVTMQREKTDAGTKFLLSGSIRNYSSADRNVPTVRVSLRNKNNEPVWGREYPVNTALKAGEVYPFRITNVETSLASSVTSIVVDMGNSLELLVR
jgi:predicted Zn finger-like uncharacterized protein